MTSSVASRSELSTLVISMRADGILNGSRRNQSYSVWSSIARLYTVKVITTPSVHTGGNLGVDHATEFGEHVTPYTAGFGKNIMTSQSYELDKSSSQ